MNETISGPVVSELVQLWFYTGFLTLVVAVLAFLWLGRHTQQRDVRVMALLSTLEWRVFKARTLDDLHAISDELTALNKANPAMSWDCYHRFTSITNQLRTRFKHYENR